VAGPASPGGRARRDGQFGPVPEIGGGFGATVGATTSRAAGAGLLNRSAGVVVEAAETGPDARPETVVGLLWTVVRAVQEGAERVAHGFAGRACGLGVGVERVGATVGATVGGSAGGAATGGRAGEADGPAATAGGCAKDALAASATPPVAPAASRTSATALAAIRRGRSA
jgi:hypothetical protein